MKEAHNKLSKDEVFNRIKNNNPDIVVCGDYINNQTPIKCYCSKCEFGKTFEWRPYPTLLFKEKACPICNKKQLGGKMISGINDLETWCKMNDRLDLLEEWDYDANNEDPNTPKHPSEISRSNSKIKVHWICSICGFKYMNTTNKRTTINVKTGHAVGCSHCSRAGTSFSELSILYYLKSYFKEIKHRDYSAIGKELDIYIPSINVAVELDGGFYHKNKLDLENEKDTLCYENKIRLIRIREQALLPTKYAEIINYKTSNNNLSLNEAINELLDKIGIESPVEIDVTRDYSKIIYAYKQKHLEDSLKNRYPNIAKEWNTEKKRRFNSRKFFEWRSL